jgi:hypothetical protein
MDKNHKALCGSKLVCVDSSSENEEIPYAVYIQNTKRSIKQYCYDTEMEFKDAFNNVRQRK